MKRTAAERDLSHLGPSALLVLIADGNRSARLCFFIHGNEDRVIPVEHSKRLMRRLKIPPMSCRFSPAAGIPKVCACRRRDVNYGKYRRFAKST